MRIIGLKVISNSFTRVSLVTYSFILFHSSVGRVGIIVNAINNFLIGGQGAMWNIRERYSPWKRGRASDGGRYLRYMGGLCFVDYHRYHATWRHHGVAFLPPPWFVPLPLLHSSPEIKHLGTGACIKGGPYQPYQFSMTDNPLALEYWNGNFSKTRYS